MLRWTRTIADPDPNPGDAGGGACAAAVGLFEQPRSGPLDAPGCGDVHSVVSGISVRDRLAQLLMVAVKDTADASAVVATYHVGGSTPWDGLSMLTDGSVADIANSAGPLAQGSTPNEVYNLALDRGRKMRDLGVTINFAPVVDVTDAPADSVIGDRSFSADPDVVTKYAGAYARGLAASDGNDLGVKWARVLPSIPAVMPLGCAVTQ